MLHVLHLGPFPLLRAPGRGQNQIPEVASSISSQGRNVLFREGIVKSAVRTTVSVANIHPLVPPPLEMVIVDELQHPSSGTLPRINILIRNGVNIRRPGGRFPIPISRNCYHEIELDL